MNAKERFYSGLAKETIGKITSNTDNWTSFLRTMSRNYEFTYPEQVMIYAQRPNATFCKPYEDWNAENYRRYVKRGSTGIALFVMNRDKPYLRYVFDVADTGVRRSSPELKPWEVTPENRSYVMEAMERTFGVAADGVLEAQLEDIASALAAEYWDDYKKQLLDIVANSFLEEYDELNIEVAFKNAVANSVSYTMYCRFVESPDNYFEHEDLSKSHFCIIDSRSNVQLVIVQVAGGAERRNAEDCGDIAAAYPLPAVCQPFLLGEVFGADQHLGFLPYVLRHPQPLLSRWR